MKIGELLGADIEEVFFDDFWSKKPIHIKGSPEKFEFLPDMDQLPRILSGCFDGAEWINTHNLKAQAYKYNQDGSIDKFVDVPAEMYVQMFNSGYGLCFNDVSFAVPDFEEVLTEFSDGFDASIPDSVTCYLTPPNSRGVLHFDNQHVFFVQRSGRKKWRISNEPAIENPFENLVYPNCDLEFFNYMDSKGYKIRPPVDCGYTDLVLEKGDVLYMPPGFYHVGNTEEDLSFHFTITIEPLSAQSKIYSYLYEKARSNSSVVNKDLRFLPRQEALKVLAESQQFYSGLLSEFVLSDLFYSPDAESD